MCQAEGADQAVVRLENGPDGLILGDEAVVRERPGASNAVNDVEGIPGDSGRPVELDLGVQAGLL